MRPNWACVRAFFQLGKLGKKTQYFSIFTINYWVNWVKMHLFPLISNIWQTNWVKLSEVKIVGKIDLTDNAEGVFVRVCEVVCDMYHPKTGELLMDENTIIAAVAHKTIKRWAYVLHDKDVYLPDDEANDPEHVEGKHKHDHWHIELECPNKVALKAIAKWFDVPENFIHIPKGKNAFLDKVEYITHERPEQQILGKYRYPDEEIKANFDFRAELDARNERKVKYGRDLSVKDRIRYEVLYNGMTLKQAEATDKYNYMSDLQMLKKFRLEYINNMTPPTTRMNFYVDGEGGIGKGLICRALARSLFPDYEDDYDIFFEVGADGAAFEGYDGQPVIIWNDRRAIDLLFELKGRGNVFNVFDTHPTRQRQKVLYGSINLCNVVHIINAVEPWEKFLDGLAGEYKDKKGKIVHAEDSNQSYRRFPFTIVLHESDYDIYLNKGFYDGTRDFKEWYEYRHIRGNMSHIANACKNNVALARELQGKAVQPIVDKYNETLGRIETPDLSEDEIRSMFADVGTPVPPEELAEDEMQKYMDEMLLTEDYASWLIDSFFKEHTTLRGTNNYPKYDYWYNMVYLKNVGYAYVVNEVG